MLKGRIITEALRPGVDLRVEGLHLVRVGRHDVTVSTVPVTDRPGAGEPADPHGAEPAQPPVWTFLDVEGPDEIAGQLAAALEEAIAPDLGWWADFTISAADGDEHVIVFAGRSFRYRIGDEAGRAEAVAFGLAAGTPEHQLDWGP